MQKRNFDFIFAYQEELNSKLITSKQRIIGSLSKEGYKILYIEVPKFIFFWLKDKILIFFNKDKVNYDSFNMDNIYIIKPFTLIPTKFLFDNLFFAKIESLLVKIYIKNKLKCNALKCTNFQVYIPKSIQLLLNNTFEANFIIYHLIDDFRYLKRAPKITNYYHNLAISLSSKFITPSYQIYKATNKKNKLFLPHGYYLYKSFEKEKFVKEFLNTNPNYIIYYGQCNKLDYDLIKEVIEKLSNIYFLFIGNLYQKNLRRFTNLKVINYLEHQQLMILLKNSQLMWCPFKRNKLSFSMTPIKFIEALSYGIPILSTEIFYKDSLTENLIDFKNNSFDHIQYINNFKKYENSEKKSLRMNAVKNRTWDAIINKYIDFIVSDY